MNKINKKAQAQIITTILIILLVLASIVIVWNVVDKAISESSSQVDVQPFLLKGDLEYSMVSSDEVKVEVNRGAGGGEILGVKIIFTDYEGNKYNYDSDPDKFPNELETEVYEIFLGQLNPNDLSSFHKIKEISFYFIYSKNSKEAFTELVGTLNQNETTVPAEPVKKFLKTIEKK